MKILNSLVMSLLALAIAGCWAIETITDNDTDTVTESDSIDTDTYPSGDLAWVKRAGGISEDYGRGISVASDGSALVIGNFGDTATFGPGEASETTLTSDGDYDIFVARYNADGTLAWAKSAGGSNYILSRGISAASDGAALVTGAFWVTATFGLGEASETILTSGGGIDFFVAKYNKDGTLAWAKSVSGSYDGRGIFALADGSALVTGTFGNTATFGLGEASETILTSDGGEEIFLAKYNADGTLAWATSAGGDQNDGGFAISALSDGSALMTGYYEGIATFGSGEQGATTLTSETGDDIFQNAIFVAKYNADGTLAWATSAGGSIAIYVGGISATLDGSALVTGTFFGTTTFGEGEADETTLTAVGKFDIFVAKYNADGTLAWARSAGGTASYGYGISGLPDGCGLVTGSFEGASTFGLGEASETTLTSAGDVDIFLAKYNADGNLAWAKRAGGSGREAGYGIFAQANGTALLTGCFEETATFGSGGASETAITSDGDLDIFVAKYRP